VAASHRIEREILTISKMIDLYCRAHHPGKPPLCSACSALKEHAVRRIRQCLYKEGKPACSKCGIHCFRGTNGERIREIMRYSGPRMLFRSPILSFLHLMDGLRRSS
jgi:hypothetical protein